MTKVLSCYTKSWVERSDVQKCSYTKASFNNHAQNTIQKKEMLKTYYEEHIMKKSV